MKKALLITLLVLFAFVSIEGKKISSSRGSGSRGRKPNYNPAPTSLSNPVPQQASAPKPTLFGWQEKPQRSQTSSRQSQSHSYPSSQTGLSGNQAKQPSPAAQPPVNNQPSHSYPASGGLSGDSGTKTGYPQQGTGLSGSGAAAPPPYSGGNYPVNNFGSNSHPQGAPPPYSNSNGYPKQGSGLSGTGAAAPPPYSGGSYPANNYGNNYRHPAPPPPYSNYGGYGHGAHGSYNSPMASPQNPGYFGNYGNNGGFGGVSRTRSALTGVGIAGAGVGTLLTGLALWNLARSTGSHRHTVIYDNRGQPVAVAPNNDTGPAVDPILGDLVNCTLTISTENATEVLAIPCAIATSFTPDADVKDTGLHNNATDNTKCIVTVVNKAGREFMTTIPCSTLLNTAAENNVTEPPLPVNGTDFGNGTMVFPPDAVNADQPAPLILPDGAELTKANLPCTPESGDVRDPINPCFAVSNNLTVIPLLSNSTSVLLTTPSSA